MSKYPLTSNEMKTLGSVAHMACNDVYKDCQVQRKAFTIMTPETRAQVFKCWDHVYRNATEHCSDSYQKYHDCLDTNERRSLKCAHLRPILEECFVKKVILAAEVKAEEK